MIFERSQLVLGSAAMQRLASSHVIVFGVGGVGGWCAEALVRSGLGHITIVDPDVVAESNINRQIMATSATVGKPKVEVLRARLLEINPQADVVAMQERFSREDPTAIDLAGYDYIVDAIDSLQDKMRLIEQASRAPGKAFSSMGAACKVDPTNVRIAEFWEVRGCPLGSALRKKMRQMKVTTEKEVTCVYSDELIPNKWEELYPGEPTDKLPNGSLVTVTATFGLTIASLVLKDIMINEK